MEEEELIRYMNSEAGGKNLMYNNFFKPIKDSINAVESNVIAKEYKG
jgi:hypothetical protein